MPKFQGVDFYDVDGLLSEDERAVRDTVRAWVDDNLLPIIGEHYVEGKFPRHLVPQMAQLGLFGANLPEQYGCAGLNHVAYGLIMQELERGDSGVRSFASVQGALVMYPIFTFGSEEQKQRWLPGMASGEVIGCFGLTEPDHGSDPGSMRTYAKRDGGDWVLNGRKMWITNGSVAGVAVVWAQTDDGIRGFVVPTDSPGFSAPEIKHKWSLRASVTSELVLDDVRLPADAVLPEVVGLKGPLSCLSHARYGIVWGAMGAARASFESAVEYAKTREQFGRPIGGFQLTQAKLADMAVELHKGILLAHHLGRRMDAGRLRPEQVSFGKLNNVREAIEICRTARTILGANGISLEYPVMRHATNLESVLTYEGTEEIHTLVLGEAITGVPAYR